MRYFLKIVMYLSFLMTVNCKKRYEKSVQKIDYSKYYTKQDTLEIATEIGEHLYFTKNKFNKMIDEHPEFFNEFTESPDKEYFRLIHYGDFGSEQGQDTYFILYAYFLKQKNGIVQYAEQRKKIIDIYSAINSIFRHLEYGGTYFGHQQARILGYAEYSVTLYSQNKVGRDEKYDSTKQKDLYIRALRQLIEDKNSIDPETIRNKKNIRQQELNQYVNILNTLITDDFYLKCAQKFHYENY